MGIWSLLAAVNFPRSSMKCSGMFYSLETNQNEIMMNSESCSDVLLSGD